MKKVIIIVVIAIIALSALLTNEKTNHYELAGMVFEVNEETTLIEDYNGNLWEVENTVRFERGQRVTMLMDNNNTEENIKDDIIEVLTLED